MPTHTAPKKPAPKDWHPADVIAAVKKAGKSLRRLSINHGFQPKSLDRALRRQWPNAERIIAEAIGLRPHLVWPTRYEKDGTPKRKRWDIPFERGAGRPQKGRFGGKHSAGGRCVNGNIQGGNSHGANDA
jgi:Ner family transcriptional regulator